MKQISVILIGSGNRGLKYTKAMIHNTDKYQVVAVAEPVKTRREEIQKLLGLADDMCFKSWEEILDRPKLADVAVIATMDDMHYEPAMKAIELGYNLLLEKPVAQTAKECADIALAADKAGVKVLVCHVLRYSPFFRQIKELVMSGAIGDIVSIDHTEGVGYKHYSHSYVRGNWHSEKETTPMLLAKFCHDIDIIQWLVDAPCEHVQSFGSRTYFIEKNAPEGAPRRCFNGNCPVADTCPYNCEKIYLDKDDKRAKSWRRVITKGIAKAEEPTMEEAMEALKTTDYGLCVFHANNDVVDHQTVNMEFKNGVTACLSMNPFNAEGRYIRIFGTKGELYAHMKDTDITLFTYSDKSYYSVPIPKVDESIFGGHGGGDQGMISELYDYMGDNYHGVFAGNIDISVKNHLIGFAAEKSRHNNTVESIDKYFSEYGLENN